MSGITPYTLRNTVRTIVGLEQSDLPDADVDVFLNRSLWWLQNLLDLPENEQITIVPTVAGQVSYTLAYPIEGLLAISLHDPDLDKLVPLTVIGGYARDDLYSFDTLDQGKPTSYERLGDSFYLSPIPDDIYDLHCRRRTNITDIDFSTSSIGLNPVLQEVLGYGAAERVFLNFRDFNSVDRMKRMWATILQGFKTQDVIEQANWKYAQVKVIRPPY
jgi:hypothetical protein